MILKKRSPDYRDDLPLSRTMGQVKRIHTGAWMNVQ